MHKLFCISSK